MRKKPKGRRFRNLVARGNVVYYERILNGRRIYRSLGVDDWEEGAGVAAHAPRWFYLNLRCADQLGDGRPR